VPSTKVVIIGGGISGLSAAYFLAKNGIPSTLIEKTDRLGGLIKTDIVSGCELEAGPDSYLAAKPEITDLAQELPDLQNQIIGSNDRHRRIFIVRKGRLMALPRGMVMMVPARWRPVLISPFFSFRTKIKFLAELMRAPLQRSNDVSVEQFVNDHFGNEVLRNLAEPLLSGVYGGDSAHLSVESVLPRFLEYERNYGSLIRGVRRNYRESSHKSLFLSFRGGMQSLITALARAASNHMQVIHAKVTRIEKSADAWRVHSGNGEIEAKSLILACPAYVCADLMGQAAPSLASDLAAIRYGSAILVNLVYKKEQLRRTWDGFGFLVPRDERRSIGAATWVSTKFPSRTPPQLTALRAFITEPQASELLNNSNEMLTHLAREEFRRLLGLEAVPLLSTVHAWPNSMPQYEVGHRERRERIFSRLAQCPGLYLIGNAYQGVGIPDCVRMAKETAKQITVHSTA